MTPIDLTIQQTITANQTATARQYDRARQNLLESHKRDAAIMSISAGAKSSKNERHYNSQLNSDYGVL